MCRFVSKMSTVLPKRKAAICHIICQILEDMVKIYQVLQNFKYIILENILKIAPRLKIVKIFLCLSTYLYTNNLFLKKFIKTKKCSSLNNALLSLPMQSSFKISMNISSLLKSHKK